MDTVKEPDENRKTLEELSWIVENSRGIDPELYSKYDVKKGLRDISGRGVLAGLTEVSNIFSYIMDDNEYVPVPGKLFYRGIDVDEIADGFLREKRQGFEETAYLILFGQLPSRSQNKAFQALLSEFRALPEGFVRDQMMKAPGRDIMNVIARSVLTLYSYDEAPDDCSLSNVLRQSLELVARFPLLAVYGYQAYSYYHGKQSLVIHSPKAELSTAENILHMLRPDSSYTPLEATLLDLALVLHAEHGGGNNSSFVTHVVTSSGTDTYSSVAAALGSLKGPRHGGANAKVLRMIAEMKQEIRNWNDEDEVRAYLERIVRKEAFDRSGLIYGIGHAVYSLSDPRAEQLKKQARRLAQDKDRSDEFRLYELVEKIGPQVIAGERRMYKGVSANVDFYSGFVYEMLNIPPEMFTPLFAVARIVGWSAHRIEEIRNRGKIIRPGYKGVTPRKKYLPMRDR